MGMKGLLRRTLVMAMAVGALTAGLITLAGPATSSGAAVPTTATWAEPPGATPNYILPFYPAQLCSVDNTGQFQWMMYRPLYWPGTGGSATIDPKLSLANTPTYSNGGTTVTINLKNYKWSNGESVTGQDVQFFMNIYHAQKANFCGYVSGYFPDNVTNVTHTASTVTFTFNKAYNQQWILYNELAQITPMPIAWDITSAGAASGSGGCSNAAYAADDAGCTKVYTFLSNAAGFNPSNPSAANNSLNTYATNPLWQVVDGPWKLKSFNADGECSFVPNPSYSGPTKATLKLFTEVPYTADSAEFNALVGGNLSVGYVPVGDLPSSTTSPLKAGKNNSRLAGTYDLAPWYLFSINYFPENFSSNAGKGAVGAVFKQLYFRQALQLLINQPLYINKIFKGYGVPTYGPVPVIPTNPYASKLEKSNPYPYNPSKAKSLLTSHGWKVVANGTDTCIKPGSAANECGAGIPAGTPLKFNEQWASGVASSQEEVTAEKASWSSVGINVTLSAATFNTVISNAVACPNGCSWELQNWTGGWTFAPDYYPSGEELFQLGAAANYGDYNDATNQADITATIDTNAPLTTWENYLAKQLPDIFQVNEAYSLVEYNKDLTGVVPQNAFSAILPENWRWK
jgi:peptide/nickel transport system substrate-binding protein